MKNASQEAAFEAGGGQCLQLTGPGVGGHQPGDHRPDHRGCLLFRRAAGRFPEGDPPADREEGAATQRPAAENRAFSEEPDHRQHESRLSNQGMNDGQYVTELSW